jgi:hypothetical protein
MHHLSGKPELFLFQKSEKLETKRPERSERPKAIENTLFLLGNIAFCNCLIINIPKIVSFQKMVITINNYQRI